MSIAEHIKPGCIVLNFKPCDRHEVFEVLASSVFNAGLLEKGSVERLVEKLEEREKLSTTGVGEGIAIPHASLEGLKETIIALGVVNDGVDFASVDNQPVKVVFMIVGSQEVPRLHIQILAKIVRLCRKKELMKKIQEGSTPEEVLEVIRSEEA